MKILHLSIIVVAIGIVTSVLAYQSYAFQSEKNSSTNNAIQTSILNEYENSFGNITVGYDPPPFSLDGKIYVVEGLALNTNIQAKNSYTIKANHEYLIEAQFTRMANIKPSLTYSVCHVQISNSTGYLVEAGWGDMIMIPKHNTSNCALEWIPTKSGNYTARAYVSFDEIGTGSRVENPPEVSLFVSP